MIKRDGLFSEASMTKSERSLHTPGSFAKQNLLYVQEVGRLQSLTPHRCIRENIDSFLFLIVLEGKGSLDIEGKHYDFAKGDCALIDCMKHYEHISDEQDAWKLAWVHFNGHMARAYYDLFCKYHNSDVFRVSDIELWNTIIGELLEKQNDKSLIAELTCGEKLLQLLNAVIECVAGSAVVEGESKRQLANEIREYLNDKYAESQVLTQAEDMFGQKVVDLNPIFSKYFGISIEEYITNRRLNAAKELLRFTIKPIEEVAEESGIGSLIVMQQLFREQEGLSAEEYRAKWAQWIRV
uniref:AraC family transcriptional regulator n=1 Tax=Acetatifactor sp. TaxID=1872090 RepID=UPI00405714F2